MDYNIYTVGDIEFVWSALNGIALIFSQYTGVKAFLTTQRYWLEPACFIKRGFGC